VNNLGRALLAEFVGTDLALWAPSLKQRTGPGQWVAEGVATFGLVLAILELGDMERDRCRCGGCLHLRRLLVHGLHLIRQSRRNARKSIHSDVQRDCIGVHRRVRSRSVPGGRGRARARWTARTDEACPRVIASQRIAPPKQGVVPPAGIITP